MDIFPGLVVIISEMSALNAVVVVTSFVTSICGEQANSRSTVEMEN